ncbi:MAG: DUF4302 domain-containing protein [Bacteroidota bacterium]|nr:DUF4302 domain-containing protein [Bacteroidota bacterium]
MKKLFILIILATAVFSACKKDDQSVFSKSADQRLQDTLTAYQTKLSTAQYGWKGLVNPKGGGTYTFYFKFNNSNRVQMLSSFDSTSAVTFKESSYRVKALQQPSLVFDTYSYIHVLADPNPAVNGGDPGVGLQSDFEFYFDSTSADTINLVGRFNGSKAQLVRATQAEATAFAAGQLANGLLLNKIQTYYKRLTIAGSSFDFYFDPSTTSVMLPDNTGNLLDTSKVYNYYLTLNGIVFSKPIVVGNQTISSINNLTFVAASQTINCTVNNASATVKEVTQPLKVDVNAPARWWNYAVNRKSYYGSPNGFHANGVEDAYKLNSIPGYRFLYFEPKAVTQGNLTIDFLGPVINDSLNYGAAFKPPFFTSTGVVVFQYIGDFGNVPVVHLSSYISTVGKMNDGSGFYLIQTGAISYDMVSARDGKSWISWYSPG